MVIGIRLPNKIESKDEFLIKCISDMVERGKSKDEALPICYSIWEESKKKFNNGLYVKDAKLLFDEKKTQVVHKKKINLNNNNILVFDDEYAYGYIVFDKSQLIDNWYDFRRNKSNHQLTEDDWKENNWVFPLYTYNVKKIYRFEYPKKVTLPNEYSRYLKEAERYIDDVGSLDSKERIENNR